MSLSDLYLVSQWAQSSDGQERKQDAVHWPLNAHNYWWLDISKDWNSHKCKDVFYSEVLLWALQIQALICRVFFPLKSFYTSNQGKVYCTKSPGKERGYRIEIIYISRVVKIGNISPLVMPLGKFPPTQKVPD